MLGKRMVYRFIDHASSATLRLPDEALRLAYQNWDHPYKMPYPYSGLSEKSAFRVLDVALPSQDVSIYPLPQMSSQSCLSTGPKIDKIWTRFRGVYPSRRVLFAPKGVTYHFSDAFPSVKQAILRFSVSFSTQNGWVPRHPVRLYVRSGKQVVWEKTIPAGQCLPFFMPVEISLNAPMPLESLDLASDGHQEDLDHAHVLWADPVLLETEARIPDTNVVMILVDTLRFDALSAMPHLQAWAKQGVLFSNAITAATWTRPSLISMWGGDLSTAVGQSAKEIVLSSEEQRRFYRVSPMLLPRMFGKNGFLSHAIGNNFFLLGYSEIGLDVGFDEVDDIRHPVLDTPAITRGALAFLNRHAKEPFFLYLHYDAPHWPYTPPNAYLKRIPPQADPQYHHYLAEAAYVDDQISQLAAEIRRLDLDKKTVVLIVGDHGEIFDPTHNHWVVAQQQPTLYHHGWSAYDEITHVPLVIVGKGVPQGKVIEQQIQLTDIAPTLLDLAHVDSSILATGKKGTGQSLVSVMSGSQQKPLHPWVLIEGQNVDAVRTSEWLYLVRPDGRLRQTDGKKPTGTLFLQEEELYRLSSDPAQHTNLVPDKSPNVQETLNKYRQLYRQYLPALPDVPKNKVHLKLSEKAPHAVVLRVSASLSSSLDARDLLNITVVSKKESELILQVNPGGSVDLVFDLGAQTSWQAMGPVDVPVLWGADALPLFSLETNPLAEVSSQIWAMIEGTPSALPDFPHVWIGCEPSKKGLRIAMPIVRPSDNAVKQIMRNWGYVH